MKDRVNRNKITSLTLEDGSQIHKYPDIHQAVVSYFQELFTRNNLMVQKLLIYPTLTTNLFLQVVWLI